MDVQNGQELAKQTTLYESAGIVKLRLGCRPEIGQARSFKKGQRRYKKSEELAETCVNPRRTAQFLRRQFIVESHRDLRGSTNRAAAARISRRVTRLART